MADSLSFTNTVSTSSPTFEPCANTVYYLSPFDPPHTESPLLEGVIVYGYPTIINDYGFYLGTAKNETFLYPNYEVKVSICVTEKSNPSVSKTWSGGYNVLIAYGSEDSLNINKNCNAPFTNVLSIEALQLITKGILKAPSMKDYSSVSITMFHHNLPIIYVKNNNQKFPSGENDRANFFVQDVKIFGKTKETSSVFLDTELYNLSSEGTLPYTGPLIASTANYDYYNWYRVNLNEVYFGTSPYHLVPFFDVFTYDGVFTPEGFKSLQAVPTTEAVLRELLELVSFEKGFIGFFSKDWKPIVTKSKLLQ